MSHYYGPKSKINVGEKLKTVQLMWVKTEKCQINGGEMKISNQCG